MQVHARIRRKMSRNRHSKRRTLFRVGRRAKLIEQHQRPVCRYAGDTIHVDHMRRKAGQVRFNRLRIPDIGEDTPVNRGNDRLERRNRDSSLCHQAE